MVGTRMSEDGVMQNSASRRRFLGHCGVFAASLLIADAGSGSRAAGLTENVLYLFCATGGLDCLDGNGPAAPVLIDSSGRLYGTTAAGGRRGGGTVFALTPNKAKTAYSHMILYSFCRQGGDDCFDGAVPVAGLVADDSGNLFGTTEFGGNGPGGAGGANGVPGGAGTVFELTPNRTGIAYSYRLIYSFCAQQGCSDGEYPQAGVIIDKSASYSARPTAVAIPATPSATPAAAPCSN
jgi:uncharacterized repeat protein (TIGR03803 family)